MAHSPQWEDVPMAPANAGPVWPLPSVPPNFSLTSFGGGRPSGCTNCTRWHAGIDLRNAPDNTLVLAPVAGTIVGVDRGWSQSAKAVYLRTPSGLFLVLGGFKEGSSAAAGVKAGSVVERGQPIGRVIGWYGMIHLETYADPHKARNGNSKWYTNAAAPPHGLLNPTWFVQSMLGQAPALLTASQKLAALAQLGYYKGDVDAPWGAAATAALVAAQAAFGLDPDGLWGPLTAAAIHQALGGLPPAPAPKPNQPGPPAPAHPSSSRAAPVALAGLLVGLWLVTR